MSTSQRVAEIRNFSTGAFFRSQPNIMGGNVNGFIATLMLRELSSVEGGALLAGNIDAGLNGWILLAAGAIDPENLPAELDVVFAFFGGGLPIGAIDATIPINPNKHLVVHAVYNPLAEIDTGDGTVPAPSVELFLNGVVVGQFSMTLTPSSGRFSIGSMSDFPAIFDVGTTSSFVGFGYRALITPYTTDYLALALEVVENAGEIMKRGSITDAGYAEPNTYMYNPAINSNNGTPSKLNNLGTAANGALDVAGDPEAIKELITTASNLDWVDIQQVEIITSGAPGTNETLPPNPSVIQQHLFTLLGKVFPLPLPTP